MKTNDFDYELPEELIAQTPAEPRDSARLMVINRANKKIEHKIFKDLVEILNDNDVLVLNETRVIPARLYCHKRNCVGIIEILLLKRLNLKEFEALARPLRRVHVNDELIISENLTAICKSKETDKMIIELNVCSGTIEQELDKIGEMPLPPYIHKKLENKNQYQTVYAKIDGSSAAPTAGLHFTNEMIEELKNKGVQFEKIVLNIGLGTFRPVQTEKIEDHKMHTEHCEISEQTAKSLNEAKKAGKRIIAVGTTTVRTLQTAFINGQIKAGAYDTNIFIYPGKKIEFIDAIITNFHLPKSTLIMLVSAFMGREQTLECYKLAVKQRYRFFSFGDAMFIY